MATRPDPFAGDTIVAIATPPGRSAIALVRLSGPAASDILRALCPGLFGQLPPERCQQLLSVHHPRTDDRLDEALVTYFPAPRSYTGEDMVELSTHGGLLIPQLVLAAAQTAGARIAQRGEFTRRALFNGKLDLTQAEAILDLIDASSPALHRSAIHQLDGGLARRVHELREGVVATEGLVAYGIDFPDEDEPPVPPERVEAAARDLIVRLDRMLATAPQGTLLRQGALVVLAGLPNAGKSSLFNALAGQERSIVTELPGTTRDAVEIGVLVNGFPFRLIDTAGLRITEDRVESIGVEVAHRYLEAADIVLYCAEADRELSADDREFIDRIGRSRLLVVRTKADLLGGDLLDGNAYELPVSIVSSSGLDRLRRALVERAFRLVGGESPEEPIVTRERHAEALRAAKCEVERFLEAWMGQVPAEFAATHLREAATALEEIIGVVDRDDVLGAVFSQFCVGK